MKKVALFVLAMSIIGGSAWAAKTTYIVTNKRFNYVKLKEVKTGIAGERHMTHPVMIDEQGLKAALASVKLSRSYIIKKEIDTQRVFDDRAIEYLAPAMVKAFAQASPTDKIVISYLSKNPFFILRNDRLNIADAWVSGNELHLQFKKLYAKVTGDVDKRGNERRAASRARGLRVNLELGPGQKMAVGNTDEIVLSLNYNYVTVPEPDEVITEGVTMTGKKVPMDTRQATSGEVARAGSSKGTPAAVTMSPQPATSSGDAKARLQQLEELKKSGLINKREYQQKRKEILKGL